MDGSARGATAPASPESVLAQAPCRVDLAGGTLDIWPLYLFTRDAVTLNFAVNILTTCRVTRQKGRRITLRSVDTGAAEEFTDLDALCRAHKPRHALAASLVRYFAPEGGLAVETHSESPAGAGISGSSALMVAGAAALARYTGRRLSREHLRRLAQDLEAELIGVPTGCQDYYPALFGGMNVVRLEEGGVTRESVPVPPDELEARFVLVYTGAPRRSGINNWEVFKAHIEGDRRVRRNFDEIAAIARAMHHALTLGDWKEVARLMRAEWKLRRTNAPGISTPLIDRLVETARRQGARAAKVCGAGGGGCLVLLVEPDAKDAVSAAVRKAGGTVLPARVAREGLRVAATRSTEGGRRA